MHAHAETTESRLQRLEERLTRTRRWLAMVLVAAVGLLALVTAAAVLAAQQGEVPEGPLRVSALHLVDDEGRVRAALEITEKGPALRILDEAGRERVLLTHEAEQTGLFLEDSSGQTRVGVAQFAHGGGGVALHGEAGRGAAVLYLAESGSLSFYDEEGNVIHRQP